MLSPYDFQTNFLSKEKNLDCEIIFVAIIVVNATFIIWITEREEIQRNVDILNEIRSFTNVFA